MTRQRKVFLVNGFALLAVGLIIAGGVLIEGVDVHWEKPRPPPNERPMENTNVNFGVWTDLDTGCEYFVSTVNGGLYSAPSQGFPTLRYRADGKPDCRDVP